MSRPLPARAPWRSIHFLPANVPKFIDKAMTLEADAFQLDLEDSVPVAEKAAARQALPDAIRRLQATGADVLVRVNQPLRHAVRDIEAAIVPGVRAISMTKVDGVSHVRLVDELVTACERDAGMPEGDVGLIVLIEAARAMRDMQAIAEASPRVVAMMLASEDLATNLGAEPLDEVLLGPKQQMIVAARAAGVTPLGTIGTLANFRDEAAFRAMVRRSRAFGFSGGTSIHPTQIAALNDGFGPQPEELDRARRVVAAAGTAEAEGRGSFDVDGRMLDAPGVTKARVLLARAESLEATARQRRAARSA